MENLENMNRSNESEREDVNASLEDSASDNVSNAESESVQTEQNGRKMLLTRAIHRPKKRRTLLPHWNIKR